MHLLQKLLNLSKEVELEQASNAAIGRSLFSLLEKPRAEQDLGMLSAHLRTSALLSWGGGQFRRRPPLPDSVPATTAAAVRGSSSPFPTRSRQLRAEIKNFLPLVMVIPL